jgi:hypothetical protein
MGITRKNKECKNSETNKIMKMVFHL